MDKGPMEYIATFRNSSYMAAFAFFDGKSIAIFAKIQKDSCVAERVGWSNIIAGQFNHLANEEKYRVAIMEYKWGQKLRQHTIVLEKLEMEQLISQVKSRQQKESLMFSILDDGSNFTPKTFEIKKVRTLKLYLYLVGAFLFFEGLPLLMIAWGANTHSPDPHFAPNPNGSFSKFIRAHFSSFAEFQQFALVTGIILCGSGLILIKRTKVNPERIMSAL